MSSPNRAEVHDAIIVGSGATGSWASKALTEAGLRVLLLEAGPSRLEMRLRDIARRAQRKFGYRVEEDVFAVARQPVQSTSYAWSSHPDAFVDDIDNPYSAPENAPFTWIRARQVGGRVAVRAHGRQFYRMSPEDFEAPVRDGLGARWPFDYDALVPHYERIERYRGMTGTRENLPQLPDSIYAEEAPLEGTPRRIARAIEAAFAGRRVIPRRSPGPRDPLADAEATGLLTLRTDALACQVSFDAHARRATGVTFVDTRTGLTEEVRAPRVLLCASAIESARLLMASATPEFPTGLGDAAGVLGRFLMDHPRVGPVTGKIRGEPAPNEPTFLTMPRFVNRDGVRAPFLRGYGVQAILAGDTCELIAVLEMLPREDSRVVLDRDLRDRWGLPCVRVETSWGDNERAMAEHARVECEAMLRAAGCERSDVPAVLSDPGAAVHEVGTARMGDDPRASYLDPFNRCWEIPNLLVLDGACFVSQGSQNPTLTMLAIASRACDQILRDVRARAA